MEARIRVDERVELFSVLFCLAGAPEFRPLEETPYSRAVRDHFAPFANDPAVALSRELRSRHGISHNAPISLAVELGITGLPVGSATTLSADLDPRWRDVPIGAYLKAVQTFKEVTGFDAFFAAQTPYIAAVEQRLQAVIVEKRIVPWLEAFLGPVNGELHVVPGLLTGPWSYEAQAHATDGKHVYDVVELERVDGLGLPRPAQTTAALIVHEMAHSYVDPFVQRHGAAFDDKASPVYELLEPAMARQGYRSPRALVEESLVRAIALLFVDDRYGREAAQSQRAREEQLGFQYIAALAALLVDPATEQTPLDLETLAPALIAFFEMLSQKARDAVAATPIL